jgi:hypothetical protein
MISWEEFERKREEFASKEYTTETIWDRREDRLELFDALDYAKVYFSFIDIPFYFMRTLGYLLRIKVIITHSSFILVSYYL